MAHEVSQPTMNVSIVRRWIGNAAIMLIAVCLVVMSARHDRLRLVPPVLMSPAALWADGGARTAGLLLEMVGYECEVSGDLDLKVVDPAGSDRHFSIPMGTNGLPWWFVLLLTACALVAGRVSGMGAIRRAVLLLSTLALSVFGFPILFGIGAAVAIKWSLALLEYRLSYWTCLVSAGLLTAVLAACVWWIAKAIVGDEDTDDIPSAIPATGRPTPGHARPPLLWAAAAGGIATLVAVIDAGANDPRAGALVTVGFVLMACVPILLAVARLVSVAWAWLPIVLLALLAMAGLATVSSFAVGVLAVLTAMATVDEWTLVFRGKGAGHETIERIRQREMKPLTGAAWALGALASVEAAGQLLGLFGRPVAADWRLVFPLATGALVLAAIDWADATRARRKELARSPLAAMALALLCLIAATIGSPSNLSAYMAKIPVPLHGPLHDLPEAYPPRFELARSINGPDIREGKLHLSRDVLMGLETEEIICWVFVDRDSDTPAFVQLHMTYYTGMIEPIIHIPEDYMRAGGLPMDPQSSADLTWSVPGLSGSRKEHWATVDVRRRGFMGADGTTRLVYYVFCVNGVAETDRHPVRVAISDPWQRHVYYAKIEVSAVGGTLPAKQQEEMCRAFFAVAGADILSHLPSVEDVAAMEAELSRLNLLSGRLVPIILLAAALLGTAFVLWRFRRSTV